MSDRTPYSSPLPVGQQLSPQAPAKKPWYKKTWVIVVAVILGLGFLGSLIEDEKKPEAAAQSAVAKQEVKQEPEAPQSDPAPVPAEVPQSEPAPEPAPAEAPTEEPKSDEDTTSGGITYGIAVQACDAAAQRDLFPGAKYKPSHIWGKQKGQVGLSEDQFLAVYNVKVDGRKTAITCLVDGTKEAPNVISVHEFEAR